MTIAEAPKKVPGSTYCSYGVFYINRLSYQTSTDRNCMIIKLYWTENNRIIRSSGEVILSKSPSLLGKGECRVVRSSEHETSDKTGVERDARASESGRG